MCLPDPCVCSRSHLASRSGCTLTVAFLAGPNLVAGNVGSFLAILPTVFVLTASSSATSRRVR